MATILVVDDNPTGLRYLATALGSGGHRLLKATDGLEALAIARTERPDLVVTDILMPKIDGFEFLRQLRADPAVAQTRVIFYTAAYDEREARELARAGGVLDLLAKPSDLGVILSAVDSALCRTVPSGTPPLPVDFERQHRRLLTDKLADEVREGALEAREHRQAEAALQESEELLRIALDAAELGTWDRELSSGGSTWDERCKAIFGLAADAPMNYEKFLDAVHPDDRERVERAGRQAVAQRSLYHVEYRTRWANGTVRWVLAKGRALYAPTDEPLRMSGVAVDITERKRAEQRFHLVVEAAPNAMIMVGREGKIGLVNAQVESLFGYTREELLGQPIEILVPARFRPQHPAYRDSFFANPKARPMGAGRDLFGLRKDGTEIPIEIGLNPIEAPEGLFTLASIIDITERTRAEEALRNSELRYRAVVESALHGIVIHQDGWIRYANAAAAQMFGYDRPEELVGRDNFETLVAPEELPALRARTEALYRGEQMPPHPGWHARRKDGTHVWVMTSATRIDWQGRTAIVAFYVDITERRQAEAEIHKLNDRLEQRVRERTAELAAANQELEAFSYSVSHDLRAPLRGIDGFSRILLEDYAPQLSTEVQEYLRLVRESTQYMGQLVDDLLSFAHLGRQPVKRRPVELTGLVRQCLDALRDEHHGRRVEISLADLPPCEAEPTLLKQVWLNLLSNALKYTRQRDVARIEIGFRRGDDPLRRTYFVKDNGVGFDMKYASKLFGVFQRLHRAEEYEGTGVGLAIVERIIQRHGGRVWAEAEPGQGATFYLTL